MRFDRSLLHIYQLGTIKKVEKKFAIVFVPDLDLEGFLHISQFTRKKRANDLQQVSLQKIAVLFSGGKDSTVAVFELSKNHKIACLITIDSENPNSFMFHTPNINLTKLQAEAMNLPILTRKTKGKKEEELADLKAAIKTAKENYKIEGVGVGAIESEYQKQRVEKICQKLGLKLLAPFWKQDPEEYIKYLMKNKFEIIITAVAAEGLDESWLGRKLNKTAIEDLKNLNKKYKIHLAGEGGEYETLVLDCPLFKKKLVIKESEKFWDKNSGRLVIKEAKLIEK